MNAFSISANVIFSIGGFIAGYIVCQIKQRVDDLWGRRHTMTETTEQPPVRRRRRPSAGQWLGAVVLVLALASTITAALTSIDQREIADCQAGFNKAYRLALLERANAANKERESVRTLWGALLNPGATTEDRRAAATKYYEALAQGDQTRDRNPLPESDSCR